MRPVSADDVAVGGAAGAVRGDWASGSGAGRGGCLGADDGLAITRCCVLSCRRGCWCSDWSVLSRNSAARAVGATAMTATAAQAMLRRRPTVPILTAASTILTIRVACRATEVGATTAIVARCGVSCIEAVEVWLGDAGIVRQADLTAEAALVLHARSIAGRLHFREDDVGGSERGRASNRKECGALHLRSWMASC